MAKRNIRANHFHSDSFADSSFGLRCLLPSSLTLFNFPLRFCCSLTPIHCHSDRVSVFPLGQKPPEFRLLSRHLYLHSIPSAFCPVLVFSTSMAYTNLPSCELREFYFCFLVLTSLLLSFPKNEHKLSMNCYTPF